ncbi:uncharacterized protein BX663DRAFT_215433 [Cokeromyces recurvatus]|uniref:uncharacterized protein n=1 Tax=Cokeromyces recurvatus TaxID=90255 RepID=UPI00221E8213|nr:uncharacterized protein BX663DRAFT_215433 [Cokeromyces recurvatus]KAI7899210.1 hypothetical protein BX663DRAFT_215433 [Cokeromyces recurvatus]
MKMAAKSVVKLIEYPERIDDYTKEELLQHMRLAKDEANNLETQHNAIKEKFLDKEIQQSLLRIDWGLIQAEIVFMAKILIGVELPEPPELPVRKLTIDQQKDWCYRNQNIIKEIGTKALTRLESWNQQAELIERKYRLEDDIMLKCVIVSDWLKAEVTDLQASYKRGQDAMMDLQKVLDILLEQTNLIEGHIKMAKTEVNSAVERLESCVEELNMACKRQDRAKSKLVAALSFGGLGNLAGSSSKQESGTDVVAKVSNAQELTLSKEGSIANEPSMTQEAIEAQLKEHKLILAAREQEFENLKRDRQLLLRDEERLLSLFTMSEDRMAETEYVKTLKLSIEHYRDRCYHLEQRRTEIEREMDKISASRQQLIEQVKSEKIAQGINEIISRYC